MKPTSLPLRRASLLLAGGLAIGFLSGWYAAPGRHSGDDSTANHKNGTAAGGPGNSRAGRISSANAEEGAHSGSRKSSRAPSKEFAKSVRSIFRETIQERRVAMFEEMLNRAAAEDFPEVVSLVRENDLRGSDTGLEWSRLWANWGKRDPAAALEFIKTHDWSGWDPMAAREAQNRALIGWSQTDPEQAHRFVEASSELANGDRSMVASLVRGWSDVDPYAAAEWLSKTGLGMRDEYNAVVEAIGRKGGREALDAWFSSLDQNGATLQDKTGFAREIAYIKREYEPEKAAAWLEQHLGEPWLDDSEIVHSTAAAFASRDPNGAMEWAAKSGLQNAGVSAMATWIQQDLPAASAWMSENSQNPAYSAPAELFLFYLKHNDPEAAKTWAENLPNPAIRKHMLEQLNAQ